MFPWQQRIVDAVLAGESIGVPSRARAAGRAAVDREVERRAREAGQHLHIIRRNGFTCTATPPCESRHDETAPPDPKV